MKVFSEKMVGRSFILVATLLLFAGLSGCGPNKGESMKEKSSPPLPEQIVLKYDFESSEQIKKCEPWAECPQKMTIIADDKTENHFLQLTADTDGWNTVMMALEPPVLVTKNTILQFKIKSVVDGSWEVNLENSSEQHAEYSIYFSVKKDQWTNVVLPLKNAIYKRHGKVGCENNGLVGDKLSRIQIASRGDKILVDDFEIINASSGDERLKEKEIPKDLAVLGQTKTSFKNSPLEKFFPYGVILNYSGGMAPTAKMMGQPMEAMFVRSLQDIRMHNMNLICPFCCTATDLPIQLEVSKKMGLKVFPTSYLKPWTAEKLKAMEKYKNDPAIVAWYWTDEPGPELINDFQKDATAWGKIGTKQPMAMALCSRPSVATYAPYLDITCIDPYPVLWGTHRPISDIDSWMKFTREYAKGRVWAIPQAFGNKTFKAGGSAMPSAAEIRALSWSAVAGGAAGLVYFIYDSHPYLDPAYINEVEKGRELIFGLKDGIRKATNAWDELGRLGETLPSIGQILLDVDIEPLKNINWQHSDTDGGVKGYLRADKAKNRNYLVFFSENTYSANDVLATFPKYGKNIVLLNLETLCEVPLEGKAQYKFKLEAGDGVCFFLGEKDKAKQVIAELEKIRLDDWRAMTNVKLEKYRPWLKNIEEYQDQAKDIHTSKKMKDLYCQIDIELDHNPRYKSTKELIDNSRELISDILDKTFNSRFRLKNDNDASKYPADAIIASARALGECELAFETNAPDIPLKEKILEDSILKLKQVWR